MLPISLIDVAKEPTCPLEGINHFSSRRSIGARAIVRDSIRSNSAMSWRIGLRGVARLLSVADAAPLKLSQASLARAQVRSMQLYPTTIARSSTPAAMCIGHSMKLHTTAPVSNSVSGSSSGATERFELRGVERLMTMSDAASIKVPHVMLVRGQVREFLRHVPDALVQTFNRHPKMRAKQVAGEFAIGEIHPHFTLEDLSTHGLLHIEHTTAAAIRDDAQWHAYASAQADIPFNRYEQFPFCLHVWVDEANDCARLFLFSDHYLSDGASGFTILNDVLAFASALSRDAPARERPQPLPVRKSLYNVTLDPRTFVGPVLKSLMAIAGRSRIKSASDFTPVVMPRSDQLPFTIPPPSNTSTLLFASGSKANLDALLAQCRCEQTTLFGALTASVLAGYAALTGLSTLQLRLGMNFNLRTQVAKPIEPETVGNYATLSQMRTLSSTPIDVASARFWDLARAAKHETNEMRASFAAMALPMIGFDQNFHAQADRAFFESVQVPHRNAGDAIVSSVGKYAHPTMHAFRRSTAGAMDEDAASELLHVESLHYNCRTQFLAALGQFYISSVDHLGYGFNHHYEPEVGKQLFEAVVDVVERAGRIDSSATLADVVAEVPSTSST